MDQPFYVITEQAWVSVLILLLASLAALVLCRTGCAVRNRALSWSQGLWLVGGGLLAGLLLWSGQFMPLQILLPWINLDNQDVRLLLGALAFCGLTAVFVQWIISKEGLSHRALLGSSLVSGLLLTASSSLLWSGLQARLLFPYERHEAIMLALGIMLAVLTLTAALWLPTQAKSNSLKVQALQRWLSPATLALALFGQLLMGLVVSSFLPLAQPVLHSLIYPALGTVVISRLLLLETLAFSAVLAIMVFYGLRVRQERALQARSILASNAIGMMLCDFDGRILSANDAFLEMVGYDRAEMEMMNLNWSALTPPEFTELDQKAAAELKAGNIVVDYEKQLLRKDGQCVDVLIAGLGQLPGYENTAMGYVLDITEKKKALQGVHESEARFRQLADSNLIGVVFWNIYGSIYDANEVFLSMLGYTRDDLLAGNINWRNVILPEDEVTQAAKVQQAIAGDKAEPYETVFLHRDGSLVNVQVGFAMLHGARDTGFSFVQDISERKRAEAALLENYQRINLILEAIPHKVWTAEPSGQKIYSNRNLLEYVGLSQEEVNATGWGAYLHPDDFELNQQSWLNALKTGQSFEVICRLKRADGQYRWHLSTAHPVSNQAGQLVLWVGTNTDIHEMQVTQDRLKESEERFRIMAEQSPLMIWVTDNQGKLSYANQRLSDFMGLSDPQRLTSQWQERIHPEDVPVILEVMQEAVKQELNFEVTFRHHSPDHHGEDGKERWMVANGNAIHLANGEFWGYVGTMVDITDQKLLQERLEAEVLSRTVQLQENMTLLHSVIENVPAMIFLKDARELRFRLFNKVGRELIGFEDDEYLNKNDYDFFPSQLAESYIQKDRETLATGQLVDIPEEYLQTKHGDQRLMHTRKVPILDKAGNPAYVLVVSEDITEFKKNQDQILDLNLKLQEQLHAISEAHKALESFSYSVSHDLRAPLRTIDGYSQVVLENYSQLLDDTGRHYLSRVREGSQQMAKLIDDMLNLSRLSRSELKKQKVNLSDMVREIAYDLQLREPEREVEFVIQDGLVVDADKRLIQSVLENLVGNAWKFTSHHPRAIIEFGQLHDLGRAVYFVRDDGAGFEMAYADKLFGTFQRLHSTSEFPGTGIGLASAQRIITRHGGEIWAQGMIEHGATFYFTL